MRIRWACETLRTGAGDRRDGPAQAGRGSRRLLTGRTRLAFVACAVVLAAAPASASAEGGAALAWGRNAEYQLGAGYKTYFGIGGEPSPVAVSELHNITELAAGGGWNLALLSSGTVRAWGGNTFGQLGNGTHEGTVEEGHGEEPEEEGVEEQKSTVSGLSEVQQISAAGAHGLALLKGGEVMAWGTDQDGELGNKTSGTETERQKIAEEKHESWESQLTPKTVKGLEHVVQIASGGASNYAVLEGGKEVVAWGSNTKGQLGIGEEGSGKAKPEVCKTEVGEQPCSTIPRRVLLPKLPEGVTVKAVSAGEVAAYALLSNGHVLAWGDNGKGALGTGGKTTNYYTPQEVAELSNAVAVSGGAEQGLAVLESGEVDGWGVTEGGDLGETSSEEECQKVACYKTPRHLKGLEHIKAVSAGTDFSLALTEGGKVYAFGRNKYGKLGTGSMEEKSNVPTPINVNAETFPVSAIAAGIHDGVALLRGGVAAPAPLVSLVPKSKSLEVTWTLGAPETKIEVHIHPANKEKSKEVSKFTFFGPQTHLFEGFRSEPYVVNVIDNKVFRAVVGTPLP